MSRSLLITGASGGMGRECARLAAAEGYDLVLADLSADKLDSVAVECAPSGASTQCHILDVTERDSIAQLITALQQAGGVDAIIHTVGLSPQMAGWERIIDVDLVGTVAFLEEARQVLKPGACAVCISSMSAHMVPPNADIDTLLSTPLKPGLVDDLKALPGQPLEHSGLAYAYAKRALKTYVADSAQAWGKEGKRIVSISPGLIDTEMGRLENDAMEDFEAMRKLIALERLGRPEDIAQTALFLASPAAAYISGCDLLVDGGFIATFNRQQNAPG